MKIKKHVVGPLQANCYLVWDEVSGEGMVVDPGGGAAKLARSMAEKKIRLQAIVYTHGHWDHTAAGNELQERTGAPIWRHPAEPRSGLLHRPRPADGAKVFDLEPGQTINLGPLSFRVIHTPGHSPGSVCLYTEGVLIAGDLLFPGSVGRWDLKGGSFRELVTSLNERLAELPDDTDVLPGHGPATTLGKERRTNPFFKSAREEKRRR